MDISSYCMNCFKNRGTTEVCPHCGYVNDGKPRESFQLLPGKILHNRYIVGYAINNGGFGIVYKAFDLKLNFIVAIKEYFPAGLVNRIPGSDDIVLFSPEKKKEFQYGKVKFLTEAKTIAKFDNHPSIVNIYDFFEDNATAYIVMEYLDGIPLNKYLAKNGGKLPVDDAIKIIFPILSALGDVHKEKIIHRDISPANIMITVENKIKLIDFGEAKFANEEFEATRSIVLKPGYAPPEQYRKKSKQAAFTDVYAVGATLYEMLTGIKPPESVDRMIEDTLVPCRKIDKNIPEYISLAIEKAMQLHSDLRFRKMSDFKEALENKRKVLEPEKELKRRKTRRASLIGVAVMLLICSVIGVITVIKNANKEKSPFDFLKKPTEITVLIPAADEEQQKVYSQVCADFSKKAVEYSSENFKVTPLFTDNFNFSKMYFGSDETPDVFMLPDADLFDKYADGLADLSEISAAYLNDKRSLTNDKYTNYIPTAFETDILYINKKTATDFDESADYASLESLPGADVVKIKHGRTLSSDSADEKALEIFANGNAGYYTGTSTDEQYIKSIGQIYTVYLGYSPIPGTVPICCEKNIWCAADRDENKNGLAKAFIAYLLTEEVQDYMYVKNSGYLPINRSVFDGMTADFRQQYRFILENETLEWVFE